MAFNQSQYWIERHRQFSRDPRSVGNLAATLEDNLKGEREWRRVASAVAEMLVPGSVLDVGCGYGRIAEEFIAHQHRYTGIDISPDAIARAKAGHPNGKFICADLLEWRSHQRYNFVLAFYVYVHFVDDDAWRTIVRKTLEWLMPDGVLVMADAILDHRQQHGPHVVTRPLAEYHEIFSQQGFRFDDSAQAELVARLPGVRGATQIRFVRR